MALAYRRIGIFARIVAIGLVAAASATNFNVMLYNGTPSMPVWLYLRTSGAVERGAADSALTAPTIPMNRRSALSHNRAPVQPS